jgi:IS1 family transposase
MNRLSTVGRGQIIGCFVEGMSLRSTSRITGAGRNTLNRLLLALGDECSAYQDLNLRNLACERVECDEIWSFCHSKEKNVREENRGVLGHGDLWLWTAVDATSKLIPSWYVGERTTVDCYEFLTDLRSRLLPGQRIQLSTDGFGSYAPVVDALWRNKIDYGQIIKEYGQADTDHRYSPAVCTAIQKKKICGEPDEDLVSTSYVERANLTIRMGMRRYTRLTNGFSKKVEQHAAATAIHFMHYNFARPHMTLTKRHGRPTTPAMAAGIERAPWSVFQIAELLD